MVRNEVGVIGYPDGGRYAVAVFTRTDNSEAKLHNLAASGAIVRACRPESVTRRSSNRTLRVMLA